MKKMPGVPAPPDNDMPPKRMKMGDVMKQLHANVKASIRPPRRRKSKYG